MTQCPAIAFDERVRVMPDVMGPADLLVHEAMRRIPLTISVRQWIGNPRTRNR